MVSVAGNEAGSSERRVTMAEQIAMEWIEQEGGYYLRAEWNLRDERGRPVAGVACVEPEARWEGEPPRRVKTDRWEVYTRAFRNGTSYGAIPPRRSFATLAQAKVAGRDALAAQGRRYAAKYGRG